MHKVRTYAFVDDMIIDARKARENFDQGFDVFFASEKFQIRFLVNVACGGSPADYRIFTWSTVNIRLRITKQYETTQVTLFSY